MNRAELKEIIGKDPGKLFERLDALGEDEDERRKVIEQVWELSGGDEPKAVRKSARKTLYMLRSRGVDVDGHRPALEVKVPEVGDEPTLLEPLLSMPDSFGSSLLIIPLLKKVSGKIEIFQFAIHREKGVVKYQKHAGSKKYLQKLHEKTPDLFPVPVDYALFRLQGALEKTDRAKLSGLSELPGLLTERGSGEVPHPVLSLIPARVSRIHSPDEERRFLEMPEVGIMMLPEEDFEEFRKQIEEAKKSRLVIGNRNPEERVEEIVERFCVTYFTGEKLELFRERLFDIALAYHHRGLKDQGRLLVSYAQRLLEARQSHLEHPLLKYLVYRSLLAD